MIFRVRPILFLPLLIFFLALPSASVPTQEPPVLSTKKSPSFQPDISEASAADSEIDYATDPFAEEVSEEKVRLSDPLEPVNRLFLKINGVLYLIVMRPAASGYRAVVPKPIRTGIRNGFHNLEEPIHFVSSLLQGKPRDAGVALGRFFVNSTVGIAGFFDVAGKHRKAIDRSLDQTFAKADVPPGPYLVLPISGPSTVRGSLASVAEGFLQPINYLSGDDSEEILTGLYAGKTVNEVSFRIEEIDSLSKSSLDPYVTVKEYYERKLTKEKGR